MYNNSVAIAGSDKCQRGTGRKGPETLLLLLPGPGWDVEVAGAGEGSHSQPCSSPQHGRQRCFQHTPGKWRASGVSGLVSCIPEDPAVLFWRAQAALGAAGALAAAQPAQAARVGGMLGTGSFLSCRGCSGCCRSPARRGVCPRVCSSCSSPSHAKPLFEGLPTCTAWLCHCLLRASPSVTGTWALGHRAVGMGKWINGPALFLSSSSSSEY